MSHEAKDTPKVYLVTESYYGMGDIIHGVFASAIVANTYITLFGSDLRDAHVEEWDVAAVAEQVDDDVQAPR